MSDARDPLPPLDDPAATQAWIDGLGSTTIDRQLAGHAALWQALLDESLAVPARWAGMLRFWPFTSAFIDRATELLAERPMPLDAASWARVEAAVAILVAMGQMAVRCLVDEREALFLGLDAQARRLRLKMLVRAEVPDEDWLDLMRMARLAHARGVMDRHGPMIEPRLPSARAMVARPLLLLAADPFALPTPTLRLVDRIAGRLARRLALRIEGPGEVPDNPLGATLAFGRAGAAMLDGRGLRDHLTRVVDDEARAANRRNEVAAASADPARETRRATASPGWPALAEQLKQCWTTPTTPEQIARRRRLPQGDAVESTIRASLRIGPLVASAVPTVSPVLAVAPVVGQTVVGPGTVAATVAGPGTVAGMPTALAIEYVYGKGELDQVGRAAMQAERRQRREQAVIERLMSEADLCFVVSLDDGQIQIDRAAPGALKLGGLVSLAMGESGRLTLVLGRVDACRHRSPGSEGLPPVQRLTVTPWPGEARVVGMQVAGDAWQVEAFYLPGVAGERPPSVIVGRGRCRPGETAALRLAETDLRIRFGDVLDQGPDFTRLAVSLVRD